MKMSRPMRARGLKLISPCVDVHDDGSRPMRARGLKQFIEVIAERIEMVAPHAGAWVETHCEDADLQHDSRAPCGRVG